MILLCQRHARHKFRVIRTNLPASEGLPMWDLLDRATASFPEPSFSLPLATPGPSCAVISPVAPAQANVSRFWGSLGWKRPGFNILLYPICPGVLRPSPVPPLLSPAVFWVDFYILSFRERKRETEKERLFDEHPGFFLPLCVNGLKVS